jgi:hypothetical protein
MAIISLQHDGFWVDSELFDVIAQIVEDFLRHNVDAYVRKANI